MGMKPENTAPGQLVPGCGEQTGRQFIEIARHPQRIHRRLAAADLLADAFLQIDDRAGFVHNRKLAPGLPSGERLFPLAAGAGQIYQGVPKSVRSADEWQGPLSERSGA